MINNPNFGASRIKIFDYNFYCCKENLLWYRFKENGCAKEYKTKNLFSRLFQASKIWIDKSTRQEKNARKLAGPEPRKRFLKRRRRGGRGEGRIIQRKKRKGEQKRNLNRLKRKVVMNEIDGA